MRKKSFALYWFPSALVFAAACGEPAPAHDAGPLGDDAGHHLPDAGTDAGSPPDDAGGPGDAGSDAGPPDVTPPALSILSPRDGSMRPGARVVVTGTASDDTALANLAFDLGGAPETVEVEDDGTFRAVVALAPGDNAIRFVATDSAGNDAEAIVHVYFGHRISVGNSQGALLRSGQLYTWGRNELGQLGNGTLDGSGWGDSPATAALPVRYEVALDDVLSIVNRQTFMIALIEGGTVATWGSNSHGQLGYAAEADCGSSGNSACRRTPTAVPGVANVIAVQAGFDHAMALLADGTVVTWGSNSGGQLGYPTTEPASAVPTAVPALTNIVQLAAGSSTSFALDADGRVWAWGKNENGQLGTGVAAADAHPTPARIDGLTGVVAVASANTTAYALLDDGTIVAWGRNQAGQAGVGDESGDDVLTPSPVLVRNPDDSTAPLAGVVNISGDGFVGGALTADGRVFMFGLGSLGQLGQGSLEGGDRDLANRVFASPVAVADGDLAVFDILEIEVGAGGPTLALSEAGHLFGWGWSFRGSLGLEGAINAWAYSTPVLVFAAE